MPPSSNTAVRREQLIAVMILAAGLRMKGAGREELRAALRSRFALIPEPALDASEIDGFALNLANTPPRFVARALDAILAAQAARDEPDGPELSSPIPVRTAAAFLDGAPDRTRWIVEPWAAAGALTAITGRPKIGKTTFLLDLVAAYLAGIPFLGFPTATAVASGKKRKVVSDSEVSAHESVAEPQTGREKRRVLYLTEQPSASFRESLARSGLTASQELSLILWRDAMALTWQQIVALVDRQSSALGARLIVIDTLSQWVGLRGDMENQAGEAFAAIQPLQHLARRGVAILFAQHERKGGGDAADAGRGSSAFAGAVDTLISFRHAGGDPYQPSRLLLALSRFDAVPPRLYIERRSGHYTAVGKNADFVTRAAGATIAAALSAARFPSQEPSRSAAGTGMTMDEIAAATGLGTRTTRTALGALLQTEAVQRTGLGKRSDPYRYSFNSFPAPTDSFPAPME